MVMEEAYKYAYVCCIIEDFQAMMIWMFLLGEYFLYLCMSILILFFQTTF